MKTIFDFESPTTNMNVPFKTLMAKHNKDFMDYLAAAWKVNVTLTPEEFCSINGQIPDGLFKRIQGLADELEIEIFKH